MTSSRALPFAVPSLFALLLASLSVAGAADRPDLTGEWELDRHASDDPLDRLFEASRRQAFRAGGTSQAVEEENRRALQEGIRWLEHEVDELAISSAGGELVFVFGEGTEVRVPADGGSFSRVGPRYQVFPSTAKWKRAGLELAATSDDGARLVETYRLADDGESLEVAVLVRGRRSPTTVAYTRVYRRTGAFAWDGAFDPG